MAFKEIVYFANCHKARYFKLVNFEFSKSLFYDVFRYIDEQLIY